MGEENATRERASGVVTHQERKQIKSSVGRCAVLEMGLARANRELDVLRARVDANEDYAAALHQRILGLTSDS